MYIFILFLCTYIYKIWYIPFFCILLYATEIWKNILIFNIQDMANYTCHAENVAGKRISDSAVLIVYGKQIENECFNMILQC